LACVFLSSLVVRLRAILPESGVRYYTPVHAAGRSTTM
jgi:hypothetical protein